jgi:pilus assembly protein Flp/PilA
MKKTIRHIRALIADEEGATAIEYGLMAALIAGVIITTVTTLGAKVAGLYSSVNSKLP